jgi:hypothetical protein
MPKPIQIDIPLRHDGLLQAPGLTVLPGGSLDTENGLQIVCDGDVVIAGTIRGKPGASLSITSLNGSVIVSGGIVLARGRDGASPGEAGEGGGSVHITAQSGEILVAGRIEAGRGGNGGNAMNHPSASDTRSGNGGRGGDVVMQGFYVSLRGGTLRAGDGGKSGWAEANGWNFDAQFRWFMENVAPAGGPMDRPPANPPDFPLIVPADEVSEKVVVSLSGNGGLGGDVRVVAAATGSLGWMMAGGTLISGIGGDSQASRALRAIDAWATVGLPGKGGKISYDAGPGGVLGVWHRGAQETPGKGGSAGGAVAAAVRLAEARVPEGGAGGKVIVEGLAPTTLQGDGGNAGRANAVTPTCNKSEGPNRGGPGGPGAGTTARC